MITSTVHGVSLKSFLRPSRIYVICSLSLTRNPSGLYFPTVSVHLHRPVESNSCSTTLLLVHLQGFPLFFPRSSVLPYLSSNTSSVISLPWTSSEDCPTVLFPTRFHLQTKERHKQRTCVCVCVCDESTMSWYMYKYTRLEIISKEIILYNTIIFEFCLWVLPPVLFPSVPSLTLSYFGLPKWCAECVLLLFAAVYT